MSLCSVVRCHLIRINKKKSRTIERACVLLSINERRCAQFFSLLAVIKWGKANQIYSLVHSGYLAVIGVRSRWFSIRVVTLDCRSLQTIERSNICGISDCGLANVMDEYGGLSMSVALLVITDVIRPNIKIW